MQPESCAADVQSMLGLPSQSWMSVKRKTGIATTAAAMMIEWKKSLLFLLKLVDAYLSILRCDLRIS